MYIRRKGCDSHNTVMRTSALLSTIGLASTMAGQPLFLHWSDTLHHSAIDFDSDAVITHVTTDAQGDIYVAGSFQEELDLDPGAGEYLVETPDWFETDMFVAKYAGENGAFQWGFQLGCPDDSGIVRIVDLEYHPSGDIIFSAFTNTNFDIDPSAAVLEQGFASSENGCVVARFSPSGALVEATVVAQNSDSKSVNDVWCDPEGGIWLGGSFEDDVDLDPGPGEAVFSNSILSTQANAFFARYDEHMGFLWGHSFGVSGQDEECVRIGSDDEGHVMVLGWFAQAAIDMAPGPDTLLLDPEGDPHIVLAKYTLEGVPVWAEHFGGGAQQIFVDDMLVDSAGTVYVLGSAKGGFSLGPGDDSTYISPTDRTHGFLAKYSPEGSLVWQDLFVPDTNVGHSCWGELAFDADGDVWMLGRDIPNVWGSMDMDPGPGVLDTYSGIVVAHLIRYDDVSGAYSGHHMLWGAKSEGICSSPTGHLIIASGANGDVGFDTTYVADYPCAYILKLGDCVPPTILGQYEPISDYCEPTSGQLYVDAIGEPLNFHWMQDGIPIGGNSDTVSIGPLNAGTYEFTCVINGPCGDTAIAPITIGVGDSPDPVIVQIGSVLHCNAPGAFGYQWYLNGVPIPGGNGQDYTPTENGSYTVTAATVVCFGTSEPFDYNEVGIVPRTGSALSVLHTPGDDRVWIVGASSGTPVEILDVAGQRVLQASTTGRSTLIHLVDQARGIYLVHVSGQVFRIVR